ncbi:MAG: Uma2 family endonuclease [Bryobacter sp.]|nr:Uma2 family endonuclease [Bryobacter sp.]
MSAPVLAQPPSIEEVLRTPGRERAEFAHGEFWEKPMGSGKHSRLQGLLCILLGNYLMKSKLGLVLPEYHHRFGPDGDLRLFIPDVAIALQRSVPDYADRASDIMIEIVSPSQSPALFADKIAFYLANGAREVWVVEPTERWIAIYQPGISPRHFGRGKTLVSSLLPGFELNVDEFFGEP